MWVLGVLGELSYIHNFQNVSLPINSLVSGRGFAYDDLYVAVTLDLPEGECACCMCSVAAHWCTLLCWQEVCAPHLRRWGKQQCPRSAEPSQHTW